MTNSTNKEIKNNCTTSLQSRVPLFQATLKPVMLNNEQFKTAWGSVEIHGRLGQVHANVLEALLFASEKNVSDENGLTKILVDPYQVRIRAKVNNNTQLKKIMTELMAAVITIQDNNSKFKFQTGHLIDTFSEAKNSNGETIEVHNKASKLKNANAKTRSMWTIKIGASLRELLNNDFNISRDPQAIASIKSGVCQAVLRHCLTHSKKQFNGMLIDTLIRIVCGGASKGLSQTEMRNRRRELRRGAGAMMKLGVAVNEKNVTLA